MPDPDDDIEFSAIRNPARRSSPTGAVEIEGGAPAVGPTVTVEAGLAGFAETLNDSLTSLTVEYEQGPDLGELEVEGVSAPYLTMATEGRGPSVSVEGGNRPGLSVEGDRAQAHISDDAYDSYLNTFGDLDNDDFFKELARCMHNVVEQQFQDTDPGVRGATHIIEHQMKDNMKAMHRLIDFATRGVNRQLMENEDPSIQDELAARLKAVEQMNNMAQGLEALAFNKALYTKEHYNKKIQEINELIVQAASQEAAQAIKHAQNAAYKRELYERQLKEYDHFYRGKFTADQFSSEKNVHSVSPKEGRGRVFHTDPQTVIVQPWISSHKSLYAISHSFSGKLKEKFKLGDPLEELEKQMKYNVDVMIGEYNKGSEQNPLNISYLWDDGSAGPPEPPKQPVEAAQMLLEFKQRAIIEGKTFYATRDDGTPIQITPDLSLSQDEKNLLKSFLKEHGTVYKSQSDIKHNRAPKKSDYTAAEIMFGTDVDNIYQPGGAIEQFLDKKLGRLESKIDKRDNEVSSFIDSNRSRNRSRM